MAANGSSSGNAAMAGGVEEAEPAQTIPLTEAETAKLAALTASAGVRGGAGSVAAVASAVAPNRPPAGEDKEGEGFLQLPRDLHDDLRAEGIADYIPRGLTSLASIMAALGKKSARLAGYGYLLNPPSYKTLAALHAAFEAYAAGAPPVPKLTPFRTCVEASPFGSPRSPNAIGYFGNLLTWSKLLPIYRKHQTAGNPLPFITFYQFRVPFEKITEASAELGRQSDINLTIYTKEYIEYWEARKPAEAGFFQKAVGAVKKAVAPVKAVIGYDFGLNGYEVDFLRSATRLTPPVPVCGHIGISVYGIGPDGNPTQNGHAISYILLGQELIILDTWPTFEYAGFIGDSTSPYHLLKTIKDAFELQMGDFPIRVIWRPCIVKIVEGGRRIARYATKFVPASELDLQFSSDLQALDLTIGKVGKCVAWATILLEKAVDQVNLQISAGSAAAAPAMPASKNSPQDIALAIRRVVYDPLQAEVSAALAGPAAGRSNALARLMGHYYGGGRKRRVRSSRKRSRRHRQMRRRRISRK